MGLVVGPLLLSAVPRIPPLYNVWTRKGRYIQVVLSQPSWSLTSSISAWQVD
jgi:hypothetical protein